MSKEFSSQNIVLGTVAAIMLVLILTIVFFAIPVGVTLCSLICVIYGIKSFSRFFEMVCHFLGYRHRFGHLYYHTDCIHVTASNSKTNEN